jgi:hypothetical protein
MSIVIVLIILIEEKSVVNPTWVGGVSQQDSGKDRLFIKANSSSYTDNSDEQSVNSILAS